MKKVIYSMLAVAAAMSATSCSEDALDIPQKGVTAIENFYKTDEDAQAAMTAAYASFAINVPGRGAGFIYTPYKFMLNCGGDDILAAGSNFGDNDFSPAINEYRYDSGNQLIREFYSGLYLSIYTDNLVIDNFKEGTSATMKRCVAEARVLRAYNHFLLAALWGNPPIVDHVLPADALPYNSDADPENPMTHEELLKWVASECQAAAADLDERKSTSDKDGAVKVTKGFAYALAGKALLFAGDKAGAKTELKKVIDSGKYALVPGEKYWENFHIEGDANEEKILESNLEFNSNVGNFGGVNERSTWMEANIWNWRSDHFKNAPHAVYTGFCDGWGGLGVPQWFGDEFFANDGHSYRFDATLKHIDDAIYNMTYPDNVGVNELTLEQKKASKEIGITDPKDGLYGQSCWLPFKQLLRASDCGSYGNNIRLNNNIVMRYAEVLLLYAEACMESDNAQALWAINQIRERAGIAALGSVNMETLKKEKSYELWLEGSRYLDIQRWGDVENLKKAGQNVPKLFDKLFVPTPLGEVTWQNDRFYTIKSHEAIDANWDCGYKESKHKFFPFPLDVTQKNPNLSQHEGW